MSSSPDLSLRARLALSAGLVGLAWGLPRAPATLALAGPTAISLGAGVLALVVLRAARRPLELWPVALQRPLPDVARGGVAGVVLAAAITGPGTAAWARWLWRTDAAAVLALLAGAAAWGAGLAATRQRAVGPWYLAAAATAAGPVIAHTLVLRPEITPAEFLPPFVFFLGADAAVALVTEELAFRRALVGPPDRAGLGSLGFMAAVFGLWHAVQPGYSAPALSTLVGTALGGFVAGCLYVLSGSLPVAAVYHAVHNAPLKALEGVPGAPGAASTAGAVTLVLTALFACGLGWLVHRRAESRALS